jgi:sec-independent protein translocase protein TatB
MFDIGFWELVIIFGLGLVVLGPERLPRVAMQIGNWAGQARRMARHLTTQIRSELDLDGNKPFTGSYTPKEPASYSRPGVDDLKPAAEASKAPEAPVPPSADAAESTQKPD